MPCLRLSYSTGYSPQTSFSESPFLIAVIPVFPHLKSISLCNVMGGLASLFVENLVLFILSAFANQTSYFLPVRTDPTREIRFGTLSSQFLYLTDSGIKFNFLVIKMEDRTLSFLDSSASYYPHKQGYRYEDNVVVNFLSYEYSPHDSGFSAKRRKNSKADFNYYPSPSFLHRIETTGEQAILELRAIMAKQVFCVLTRTEAPG